MLQVAVFAVPDAETPFVSYCVKVSTSCVKLLDPWKFSQTQLSLCSELFFENYPCAF